MWIAAGSAMAVGCKPCTSHHVRAARGAGATDEEMKGVVELALSVHGSAAGAMEGFFLTRLGAEARTGDQREGRL